MKLLLNFCAVILISGFAMGQDRIEKVNGDTLFVKVVEITKSNVYYTKEKGENPARRNISSQWIYRIVFESGEVEYFNESGVVVERRRGPDRKKYKREGMLSGGFYFDGLIGLASGPRKVAVPGSGLIGVGGSSPLTYENKTMNYISMGLRFGNKWFFGQSKKYRFGLNVNWLRLGLLVNDTDVDGIVSPVSVGLASVFKFKENVGLEWDTYTGVSMLRDGNFPTPDLLIGTNLKFRYQLLAIGFDYGHAFNVFGPGHTNLFSITAGVKF